MACPLTLGRLVGCADSTGGVFKFYLVSFGTLEPVFDVGQANKLTDLGAITAYEYQLDSDASSLVQTGNKNVNGGAVTIAQVFTGVLSLLNAESDDELKIWQQNRPHIVVQYKTGDAVVIGFEFGTHMITNEANGGAAMEDGQAYTVTANGNETSYAMWLDGATIEDAFAGMMTPPDVVVGV